MLEVFTIHIQTLVYPGTDYTKKVCILLYADDVVFLANDEKELQILLNALDIWCGDNCITINSKKCNIVHFRTPSVNKSYVEFKCGKWYH